MKKILLSLCIVVCLFSMVGCSNSELEELRYQKDIENKKIEAVVSEFNKNIAFFEGIESEIANYLFLEDKTMYDFRNHESVFYNSEDLFSLYFARERMYSYIKKYELDPDDIHSYLQYYPFMVEETGGLEVYYRVPIEDYAVLNMTLRIQEEQIIFVEYSVDK